MNGEQLWAETCRMLKEELNPLMYTSWIENTLKPVRLEQGFMYVEAASAVHQDYVSGHYAPMINDCMRRVLGQDVSLRLLSQREADEMRKSSDGSHAISPLLNPRYTFETFVVGKNNMFASAACLAVADSPAEAYNPLFIYGGVGLGKTHLMHAIGHFILQKDPSKRVEYVTTEMFTNELINAIQNHKTAEFRDYYRTVDVLLIDDIQFLARAERTQEEFFHTFNALHSAHKQIVICSDRPPKEIPKLEERLSSRFEWGLIADVQRPDYETRVAILQRKAKDEQIPVTEEAIKLIAERVESNIRELEGCLTKLNAYAALTGGPMDEHMAQAALREVFQRVAPRQLDCDTIINVVAQFYSVTPDEIRGPKRNRDMVMARQVAMFLCRDQGNISFPRIGQAFSRDHSTVQHACEKVAEDMKTNTTVAWQISDLVDQLRAK